MGLDPPAVPYLGLMLTTLSGHLAPGKGATLYQVVHPPLSQAAEDRLRDKGGSKDEKKRRASCSILWKAKKEERQRKTRPNYFPLPLTRLTHSFSAVVPNVFKYEFDLKMKSIVI